MTVVGRIKEGIYHTKEKECKKIESDKEYHYYNEPKKLSNPFDRFSYIERFGVEDELDKLRQRMKENDCPFDDDDNEIFKIADFSKAYNKARRYAEENKIYNEYYPDDPEKNSNADTEEANEWKKQKNDSYPEYSNETMMKYKEVKLIVKGKKGTLFPKAEGDEDEDDEEEKPTAVVEKKEGDEKPTDEEKKEETEEERLQRYRDLDRDVETNCCSKDNTSENCDSTCGGKKSKRKTAKRARKSKKNKSKKGGKKTKKNNSKKAKKASKSKKSKK